MTQSKSQNNKIKSVKLKKKNEIPSLLVVLDTFTFNDFCKIGKGLGISKKTAV